MLWVKFIVELLQALATPAIAVVGSLIAYRQWKISDAKLRLDLFERRWAIFAAAGRFLADTVNPTVPFQEAQIEFTRAISGSLFLFDHDIDQYLKGLLKKAERQQSLKHELEQNGSLDAALIVEIQGVSIWALGELIALEKKFAPFMQVLQNKREAPSVTRKILRRKTP